MEKDGQNTGGRLVNWEFYARRRNKLIAKGCESPTCTKERGCSLSCRKGWDKTPWDFTVVTLEPFSLWPSLAVDIVYKPPGFSHHPLIQVKCTPFGWNSFQPQCIGAKQNDRESLGRELRLQPDLNHLHNYIIPVYELSVLQAIKNHLQSNPTIWNIKIMKYKYTSEYIRCLKRIIQKLCLHTAHVSLQITSTTGVR